MPSVSAIRSQPPVAPLNPAAQQALTDLLQAQASRKRLAACLTDAAKKLTEVAGQLNDRGTDQRLRHAKLQARLEANGEEMNEEDRVEHEDFQAKVKDLTQKMDHGIRGIIDGQTWLDNVPVTLKSVATKTGALAEATQQQTQGPTPIVTQRTRPEPGEGMDADDAENTDPPIANPPHSSDAPTALLRSAFAEQSSNWQSKSLKERYANSNEYTGFYRTVYDAKNPGENAPPIPHASLWFAEEEDPDSLLQSRSQAKQGRQADDDEDSDVEIALERVSLKCPITLLPFRDPLTSMKCPHSFEKDAILDMLRLSSDYLPFTANQEMELSQIRERRALERKKNEIGIPTVKCPVCSCTLVAADLKPDPVLLRKVKRVEAAMKRQRNPASDTEEEDDDDEAPRGSQRKPVGLGSSPARRASGKAEMIKKERARSKSRIPQTQLPSGTPTTITAGGATVVDLGEDDEEDEDEDEEMDDS
jgi:SUMO ligase MMS21 Smc5/6 complex component